MLSKTTVKVVPAPGSLVTLIFSLLLMAAILTIDNPMPLDDLLCMAARGE